MRVFGIARHEGHMTTAIRWNSIIALVTHCISGLSSTVEVNDIADKNNLIQNEPKVVQRLVGHLETFEKDIAKNNRPTDFVKNPKSLSK
jgi:hypothetical protein